MKPRAIVLSGPSRAGKSTLAANLRDHATALLIRTADLIRAQNPNAKTKRTIAAAGQRLDRETQGSWVADALNKRAINEKLPELIVIDCVRSTEQVQRLRQSGWFVIHVHLSATQTAIEKRDQSSSKQEAPALIGVSVASTTDRNALALSKIADVVIDTDRCNAQDVFARVAARYEARPVLADALVDVMIGGQYGSEGKGNLAHYLAPEYDVLVRVGGPNAGHQVFVSGAPPYTFRQLPSGAIANRDAMLVIGAGAVIGLDTLLREIADLAIPYEKLIIDPRAIIIDAEDVKWEQDNLKAAIGSTAQGIGRATARKILERVPNSTVQLAESNPALKHYIRDSVEYFSSCLSSGKRILLEGTQGTSLSLHHGFYPHVTSRATTASACLAEAGLATRHVRRVIMVCRTYPIRVGDSVTGKTSGYMSQEITFEEISKRSGVPLENLKSSEIGSVSGRPRRVAEFDWSQFRRSMLLNGPTDIALTFADYISVENRKAYRYEQLSDETLRFIEELEKVSGVSVSLISTAFNERNIIDRRMW